MGWSPENIHRLLVVELAGLGDAVMLTPFFRELKKVRSDLRVSVLTFSRAVPALENSPYVDSIYAVSDPRSLMRLVPTLRRLRFDVVMNTRALATDSGALKMAALMSLVGGDFLIGRDQEGRGRFLDVSVEEKGATPLHKVEQAMSMLLLLGIPLPPEPWPLEVFPQPEHFEEVERVVEPYRGRRLVCLHPHSFRPTRRWPLESFISLAEALARDHEFVPLFTVGRDDPPKIVAALQEKGFPLFVSQSPLSLSALYDHAACVVVNDTGPMHLAVSRLAPIVALLGPSDETETRPWSDNSIVLKHTVLCSPCYYFDCPMETHCMSLISVREVESAVRSIVG